MFSQWCQCCFTDGAWLVLRSGHWLQLAEHHNPSRSQKCQITELRPLINWWGKQIWNRTGPNVLHAQWCDDCDLGDVHAHSFFWVIITMLIVARSIKQPDVSCWSWVMQAVQKVWCWNLRLSLIYSTNERPNVASVGFVEFETVRSCCSKSYWTAEPILQTVQSTKLLLCIYFDIL